MNVKNKITTAINHLNNSSFYGTVFLYTVFRNNEYSSTEVPFSLYYWNFQIQIHVFSWKTVLEYLQLFDII